MKKISALFFCSFYFGAGILLAPSSSFNEESLADQMVDIDIFDSDDKSFVNIPTSPKGIDSLFEFEEELFFNFKFIVTEYAKDPKLLNIELESIPPARNHRRLARERFINPKESMLGMRFDYQSNDSSEKVILEIMNISINNELPSCKEFLCSGLISCRIVGDDFLRVSSIATKVLIEEHVFTNSCKSFMSEDGKKTVRAVVKKGVAASQVGLWLGVCILATIRDVTITALESTKTGR